MISRTSTPLFALILLTLLLTPSHSQAPDLSECDPIYGCSDFSGFEQSSGDGGCNTGAPGSFLLTSPNSTSIVAVGNRILVNWTYNSVSPQYPNNSIAIYYALTGTSQTSLTPIAVSPQTWYSNPIVTDLAKGVTQYSWMVPSLQSGKYQLRIVGDGLDPALRQPLPYTSTTFRIVGNGQLNSFGDNFGPSNRAEGGKSVDAVGSLVASFVI
ncbi:hypothetical protein BC829DRAFT_380924 [Chytridium lagenaria]|nr:hypothetical protein BC829DRAFT_380924 [Chytridium lagenaria]